MPGNRFNLRKIKLHYCFFKSTVVLTVVFQVISVLCLVGFRFADESEPVLTNIYLSCLPIGIAFDFLYKEMVYKETYYFYYNQGIRKVELWIFSFCGWSLVFMCLYSILHICVKLWKLTV